MTEPTSVAQNFQRANKKSPVVAGAVMYIPGEPECPENVIGCRYTLENGSTFSLKSADLRTIPAPEWKS
jgi:hypothetical protein